MADQFKPNVYSQYLWNLFKPTFTEMGGQAADMATQPNYGIPSASGVYSGVPMYSLPNAVAPTSQWWNSLSPEVKAGAWAPYQEQQNQMLETLGANGQIGSARGGYSGAAGAALGQFMADATPAYASQLWGMSQPGLMADYQAQLGRSTLGYQNQINENLLNFQNQMQAWQMPWNMMLNYNNLAPSGAYHSDGGGTLNSILGAGTSLLGPIGMGVGFGLGGPFGGMIGGGVGNSFGGAFNSLFNPYMGGNMGTMSPYGTYGR